MDQNQLLQWTRELSETYFRREFHADIVFNGRLRTTGGRYIPQRNELRLTENI